MIKELIEEIIKSTTRTRMGHCCPKCGRYYARWDEYKTCPECGTDLLPFQFKCACGVEPLIDDNVYQLKYLLFGRIIYTPSLFDKYCSQCGRRIDKDLAIYYKNWRGNK